jgi:Undecaprenyl-phosphate galactose phosphotransferase WbaP
MSTEAAFDNAATSELGTADYIAATDELDKAGYFTFKERRWVPAFMFFVDVVAIEAALYFGYLIRFALSTNWPATFGTSTLAPSTYEGLILGVLLVPVAHYLVGLHAGYGISRIEHFRRRLTSTVSVFGVLLIWDYVAQSGAWSRGVILATLAVAILLTPLLHSLARSFLIRISLWGIPVLLIGTDQEGVTVARILRDDPEIGFVPIGFLESKSASNAKEVAGLPVLGHVSNAEKLRHVTQTVIITTPKSAPNGFGHLVKDLPFPRIIMLPELTQFPSLWVTTRDLSGVLALELPQNLLLRRNRVIKRISDYVLTIPLFLSSLPILAVAALCIKIASPGEVFYGQEREGLRRRAFRMCKLRTMYQDAERRLEDHLAENPQYRWEWENHMKLKQDPRVIPGIGRWLRKTSIDELPQLWDVLRGRMSLIGPRPFPLYHLEKFTDQSRELRAHIRPGITGLWQVAARSEADIKVQEELDMYYIRNWSLWLDLYILAKTIPAVLKQRGAL